MVLAAWPFELAIVLQGVHVPDTMIDLVVSQTHLRVEVLKIWPLAQGGGAHTLSALDQVYGEVQPHPVPDRSPVPPFPEVQVKQTVVEVANWLAPQQAPPPAASADQVVGELHLQAVVLAVNPEEPTTVLQGVHVPEIIIDLVVSQMQAFDAVLKICPLEHVGCTHVLVVPDQV